MKSKHKTLIRVGLFCVVAVLLFSFLNTFFQPVWVRWNNYDTTYGFYEEPKNTIETVFLGPSVMVSGVIPAELYSNYGICAYNLATEQQPLLASYYWLEETYRLHGDTLKTVVLDVSELREDSTEAFYHKALDAMKLSPVKYRAIQDYTDGDLLETLTYLMPLHSYHDRWSDLEDSDFRKFSYTPNTEQRGYLYDLSLSFRLMINKSSRVKDFILDESAEPAKLNKTSLKYLDKMATFCKEKGLDLLFVKTPTFTWTSAFHNATAELAEKYQVEFLDFNFDPYYGVYDYIYAFDSQDGLHLNHYGASKFTAWLGQYLVDNYDATDVRGNEKYDYMKDIYAAYEARVLTGMALENTESIEEYLSVALKGDNTVFVIANDEASKAMTDEQRAYFADLGLHKLSRIGYRNGYIGILNKDRVVYEMLKYASDKKPLKYISKLADGTKFFAESGGHNQGRVASLTIQGVDYAENMRGLNVVVYSNVLGEVVHSDTFDLYTSPVRERYSLELSEAVLSAGLDAEYEKDSIEDKIVNYQKKVEKKRVG